MRSIRLLFSLLASALCFTPPALAQVPDPAPANAAPIPGAGHHYIGVGTETVNPADGLLSFELPIQTPAGRQLTLPFGFRYSSAEQFYLTNNGTGTSLHYVPRQSTGWEMNGWSYDLPTLAASSRVYEHWTTYTGQPPQGQVTINATPARITSFVDLAEHNTLSTSGPNGLTRTIPPARRATAAALTPLHQADTAYSLIC